MKKTLIGIALVAGALLVAVLALPFLVPLERFKAEIAERTEEATGRRLTIAGDLGLSVLPALALRAERVTLANAPGGSAPDMLRLRELVLEVALGPLLAGELAVERLLLIGPELVLEADAGGRPNWVLAGEPGAPGGETAGAGLADLRLGEVRIEDGSVSFVAADGRTHRIEAIDLALALAALEAPLEARGSARLNGETLALDARVTTPATLLAGEPTELALALSGSPLALDLAGQARLAETLDFAGELAVEGPSLRALAAWLGSPVAAAEGTLGAFSLAGTLAYADGAVRLDEVRLELDDIAASGALALDPRGARPRIEGTLRLGRLDLTPYLPPPAEGEAAGPADWSDAPIDVSGLRALDASLSVRAEALVARTLEVGPLALALTLDGGDLVIDASEMRLYGGVGQLRLRVDARGAVPRVEKRVVLSGVAARPLLAAAGGLDRIEGTAEAAFSLAGAGLSERALVADLDGEGRLRFTDGAIVGISLAAMVRNVRSAFLDPTAERAQKTDFAELSASFRIEDGLLTNRDARLLAPLLRLAGSGTVDLPARRLAFRIEPKLAATTEGQGGAGEVAGVMVPVIVEGPWDDLSVRPDLAGIAAGAVQNPAAAIEGAKEAVGGVGKSAGSVLEGVAGGGETDPLGAVKKLFGD